jgi:hypothetical protein
MLLQNDVTGSFNMPSVVNNFDADKPGNNGTVTAIGIPL